MIYPLPSILEPLEFDRLFPTPQPVEVELGSGDGSFLIDYAGQRRDRNFIGVERLLGRLRKIDRKCRRLQLLHVRAIRIEAGYFLRWLLPPASVQALHVYFPDPWPKKRHARHRLINDTFPAAAARVLVPGGCVYLRTDDVPYHEQMQSVFAAAREFVPTETPPDLAALTTDFEREFLAQGKTTLRLAYTRWSDI